MTCRMVLGGVMRLGAQDDLRQLWCSGIYGDAAERRTLRTWKVDIVAEQGPLKWTVYPNVVARQL